MDYQKLGLKCGIEIHQQLDTRHKLFCECSADFRDKEPVFEVKRKLRAVAGELGDIDAAAAYEVLKDKVFHYRVYLNESCSVELDEEPPHPVNMEALEIALETAMMLNCRIPEEIHVMRKTVIDGSNTSGFQRTAIVGLDGFLETGFGMVGIQIVSLEEESSQIIEKKGNKVVYGLNRLGIPLVEIGTAPDIKTPEQAREVAEKIGMILRSTRVKKGLGTIRQDLNVSIEKGARVEIKGVQSLSLIPKAISEEVLRQKTIIEAGKKLNREVRKALPDGRTEFLRPLPGAARLYPETDIPPVRINSGILNFIKKNLPEILSDKTKRLSEEYDLSDEIISQLVSSGKGELFEDIVKLGIDPRTVATTLTSTIKDLKRRGVQIDNLSKEKFIDVFKELKSGKITKDSLQDLLAELAKAPEKSVKDLIKKLGAETLDEDETRKIIQRVIKQNPEALKAFKPENVFMGLVMKEIRGKASGELVSKILREELKN